MGEYGIKKGITLNIEILILKEWDYDGNEVHEFGVKQWDKYILQNNEKEIYQEMNVMDNKIKKFKVKFDELKQCEEIICYNERNRNKGTGKK